MVPTILVLDCTSTVQRVMELALREERVRVNAVQYGADAFSAIDAHPPDIIFTEDARKIVSFLKTRPTLPRIPVVLLKGAFHSTGADENLADEVLMKPLQPDAMIDCVRRLLWLRNAATPQMNSLPAAAEHADGALNLEQYFDRLEAAFNETDSTPSELEGELWDSGFSSAADAGQKSVAITRAGSDRAAPTAPVVTSELVDQITQRVLDRLGERIVRSTATEVVSRLSKWLLVNELERSRNTQ